MTQHEPGWDYDVPAVDADPFGHDHVSSWQPADLTDVLSGDYEPPKPSVGSRADGVGLVYPGRKHSIASESEGGKTWMALAIAEIELARGNHVVYLDFEDEAAGVVGRLLSMQVHREVIRAQFHYIRPLEPFDLRARTEMMEHLQGSHDTVVFVDGVTEAMSLHGLDPLSNKDAARFNQMLVTPLTVHGAAVVVMDHVTKSTETRGRHAIGAVHKLNVVDGCAYLLENRQPIGIGLTGRSTVRIAKDRPGRLRASALPSNGLPWFADLVVESRDADWVEVSVEVPIQFDQAEFRPTALMAKIASALDEHGPMPQRQILATVKGRRQYAIDALSLLQRDGFVSDSSPHKLLKKFDPEGGADQ